MTDQELEISCGCPMTQDEMQALWDDKDHGSHVVTHYTDAGLAECRDCDWFGSEDDVDRHQKETFKP